MTAPFSLWVYLSTSPLLWLTVTFLAWIGADALARLSGRNPLANPVLIAIILLSVLLKLTGTDYKTYFDGAQFVHFLLGPATVALALPLYANWALVRRYLLPMAAALIVGSATAIISTLAIASLLGRASMTPAKLRWRLASTPHCRSKSPPPSCAATVCSGRCGAGGD